MRIPLEDDFNDVIVKSQRGLGISDEQLCTKAQISREDLRAVQQGKSLYAVIRRVARHLRLNPDALEELAKRGWYPDSPVFPHGFAMFNTPYEDIRVNSYLAWDARSKLAAAFDTGADCQEMLDVVRAENLRVGYIFITHTHEDHIGDLKRLSEETGAQVWSSEKEPVNLPGASTFKENVHFHVGSMSVKTLLTSGHSPGQTSFYITGLSYPLAVVGDSLFAGSMGGSQGHFEEQHRNDVQKILALPRDTVLACGHGPLSTVGQEKRHNPFFAG